MPIKKLSRWLVMASLALLSVAVHAGTKHYYYTDPQGTVLAKADAQGNIVASYDYAPYGTQVLGTPPSGPTGYTGHVNDVESGFVYMQARYYDPAVGRFLSVDPVGVAAGDVFNFFRYAYANNNPIRFIDPTGEATAYIRPNGDVIIVQKYINTSKSFTDAQISNVGKGFDGMTSDGRSMIVLFVPGSSKDKDVVTISSDANLDDTSTDGRKRSHIDMIGGRKITLAPNAVGISAVGHELGHALRAGDQYKHGVGADGQPLGKDVPGLPSIMKTSGSDNANQQTMDEIYNGIHSPENTIVRCTPSGSNDRSFCP